MNHQRPWRLLYVVWISIVYWLAGAQLLSSQENQGNDEGPGKVIATARDIYGAVVNPTLNRFYVTKLEYTPGGSAYYDIRGV